MSFEQRVDQDSYVLLLNVQQVQTYVTLAAAAAGALVMMAVMRRRHLRLADNQAPQTATLTPVRDNLEMTFANED